MIERLRSKIASLAMEVSDSVSYTLELSACSPKDNYCSSSESHRLYCSSYKTIYRVNIDQVFNLTANDFVKREDE